MSLPYPSPDSGDGRVPVMPLEASDAAASLSRAEPGFRVAADSDIESGLDGFDSEDGDSDSSPRLTVAQSVWAADGNAARLAPDGHRHEPAQQSRSSPPCCPWQRGRLSQSPGSVAGMSGRARIAAFVPRLIQSARLDRIASTAALVGQTGARVTSRCPALAQPWWRIDPRLAFLLVLSLLSFAGLWSVSQRLSNPAASLAESAGVSTEPVVAESVEAVVSHDKARGEPLRMRMTFRSVTPAGTNVDRTAPSWVAVSAPVPVENFEHGQQIGTSWNGG